MNSVYQRIMTVYNKLVHQSTIYVILVSELPILRVPQFYQDNRSPTWGCWSESASIMQPPLLQNIEAPSISLNTVFFEATSRKYPHFPWHFTLLVPHLHRQVPQAYLSCLRQLETLPCVWTLYIKHVYRPELLKGRIIRSSDNPVH